MKDSDKTAKTRISVTMTKTYLDALDHMIDEGIYRTRGEAVLEGLRILLGRHGIELPYHKET